MGKMNEEILAVHRNDLFEDELLTFQGLLTDWDKVTHILEKFQNYIVVNRGAAEVNEQWKQLIPYVIIRRGESVFMYKRLKQGGEKRLHGQLSIGVGGHMNDVEGDDIFKANIERELYEELDIWTKHPHDINPKVIGLINDDLNEVGRVHIGVLCIVELPYESTVEVRETDVLEGYWTRIRDLKKSPLYDQLETWSQIAADIL